MHFHGIFTKVSLLLCLYNHLYLRSGFLRHLHTDISTVVSLILFLPTSLWHVFLQYLHGGVFMVLSLQFQSSLLRSLLSVFLPRSLLLLYGYHGYIVVVLFWSGHRICVGYETFDEEKRKKKSKPASTKEPTLHTRLLQHGSTVLWGNYL